MSKYRFKTKEEFIRDGRWIEKCNAPYGWATQGEMNKYLGTGIPDKFNKVCDDNKGFEYNAWYFEKQDYVLKKQQEYFEDLLQHIGRYIRALVDNPNSGSRVYKGDVGKIISYEKVDFPNRKGYKCTCALDKDHLGIKYELLPEDYSPEQEVKEPNIEFIPGKWYNFTTVKGKYNLYVKVDFFTNEELYFTDGRYICNKSYDHASSIDIEEIENPRLVEDLSEIQKYLPDGHPDKIINQKFEIGKWYKWYQKNHGNYHYGKVKEINVETDTLVMSPWIMQCTDYTYSGSFDLLEAEQIQEISVEEVQEFLPNSHPDKITSDEFKKGEYIVIIKMIESYSKDFTSNYIYKQREDYKHLRSELDNYGRATNGWETIGKKDSHTWRYATQEEIDEYERRGKPYDVTELNKQSFPKENITEVPEYIECTETREYYFIKGNIYKVIDSSSLTSSRLVSNIDLCETKAGTQLFCLMESYGKKYWKPSTKEAYEQQKNWLGSPEESFSRLTPTLDPYEGTIANISVYDEAMQYPSTASNYWTEIPKFVEQEFDIYGPTPDIE